MSGIIVVGVDGSATARRAAESARDLAVALGGIRKRQ
jgi:nucleotide-binding universal stress UspA family protein